MIINFIYRQQRNYHLLRCFFLVVGTIPWCDFRLEKPASLSKHIISENISIHSQSHFIFINSLHVHINLMFICIHSVSFTVSRNINKLLAQNALLFWTAEDIRSSWNEVMSTFVLLTQLTKIMITFSPVNVFFFCHTRTKEGKCIRP